VVECLPSLHRPCSTTERKKGRERRKERIERKEGRKRERERERKVGVSLCTSNSPVGRSEGHPEKNWSEKSTSILK
jgi:hypothetical protein